MKKKAERYLRVHAIFNGHPLRQTRTFKVVCSEQDGTVIHPLTLFHYSGLNKEYDTEIEANKGMKAMRTNLNQRYPSLNFKIIKPKNKFSK